VDEAAYVKVDFRCFLLRNGVVHRCDRLGS
jgi:hypothetical protein